MGLFGIGQHFHDALQDYPIEWEPAIEDLFGELVPTCFECSFRYFELQCGNYFVNFGFVFCSYVFKDVPYGFNDPLDADWSVVVIAGLGLELLGFGVVVEVAPEVALDLESWTVEFAGDKRAEVVDGEAPVVECGGEDDVFLLGAEVEHGLELVYCLVR